MGRSRRNSKVNSLTRGEAAVKTDKTIVKIPRSKSEASSNWKLLASGLPEPKVKPMKRSRGRYKKLANSTANDEMLKTEEAADKAADPAPIEVAATTNPIAGPSRPSTSDALKLNAFGYPAYDAHGNCLNNGNLPPHYGRNTKAIAMDCEMVGVGPGGTESALARIALVNEEGLCLYHRYVKPKLPVTDYRTHVSGIRAEDLINGCDIHTIMREVSRILQNHLLVGHAVWHDLKVLFIRHPRTQTRDTAHYFKSGYSPKLSKLTAEHLGVGIQNGEHNPIEDAQATMKLYLKFKKPWERGIYPNQIPEHLFNKMLS